MKRVHGSVPSLALAALLASGLAVAGHSASAEVANASNAPHHGVAEGQAVVTELGGNAKAVTYWTRGPEGALVVTTVDTVSDLDSDAERHAVVRLQSVLQPGQAQEISVPLSIDAAQPVLRIERVGDLVTVAKVTE
jgi:hypothetical protein